jgi:hypothetical protein
MNYKTFKQKLLDEKIIIIPETIYFGKSMKDEYRFELQKDKTCKSYYNNIFECQASILETYFINNKVLHCRIKPKTINAIRKMKEIKTKFIFGGS